MPVIPQEQVVEEEKTTFYLQGFSEERQLCMRMSQDSTKEAFKEYVNKSTIHTLLECPLGVTYFHKFLTSEMNVENLQCYLDLKSLMDYIKYSKKCPLFDIEKVNKLEEEVLERMESDFADEYQQDLSLENVQHVTEETVTDDKKTTTTENQALEERMAKHGEEVMKKSRNFMDNYISESAAAEVNIDHSTRRAIIDAYAKVAEAKNELNKTKERYIKEYGADFQLSSSEEMLMKAAELKLAVQNVEFELENLKNALLANLSDPLSRFKHSKYLDEVLTLLMTSSGNTNFHRDRLLSANKGGVILNMDLEWPKDAQARSPLTVIEEILTQFKIILSMEEAWGWDEDNDILKLNFDIFEGRTSPVTKIYHSAGELSKVDLNLLATNEEKLTFWINAYNVIMLHAVLVAHGIPLLEVSRQLFYRKTKYLIGGMEFSLEDIREGILFGNTNKCIVLGRQFKKNDQRKQYSVQTPTIQTMFALACFSMLSPNVEVMKVDTVRQQLDKLTKTTLDRYLKMDSESKNVVVAPVYLLEKKSHFKLYSGDAEMTKRNATDAVIQFIKKNTSHFADESHKNDVLIFKDEDNVLVSNMAPILDERDRAVLEKKKRVAVTEKAQQKKKQETGTSKQRASTEEKKKFSWPTPKSLHTSFKRFSMKRKQKKIAAQQQGAEEKKCRIM